MEQLERLILNITRKVNINLRHFGWDVSPYFQGIIPLPQLLKFYAFYGVSAHHTLHFHFGHSNLSGSYFLGKCRVDNSILYKSDIRGDELKVRGDSYRYQDADFKMEHDEEIRIKDSMLIKTLVHNNSHDPQNPELFLIKSSLATPYANIHGSPVVGCFLAPFSTVDLTSMQGCTIGRFAYVQAGELFHRKIRAGQVWVCDGANFDFDYHFVPQVLDTYVNFEAGAAPGGILMDFVETHKVEFQRIFDVINLDPPLAVHTRAALSRYAVFKGKSKIDENVLVAQRAYLDNARLGKGSNAQENCYIIDSELVGDNVTAHGAKIINARLGRKTFVGFNSFLRGNEHAPLTIGQECIVMPHTIIDLKEPLDIPAGRLIWGHIRNREDLNVHSRSLVSLSRIKKGFTQGRLNFRGNGAHFVQSFQDRIEHILEANGAYFDGLEMDGHAQRGRNISFNIMQPYRVGEFKGLFPTIDIRL